MTDRTDTLPPPIGWFESPHGVFRANPHLRVQFPPSSLEWQIGVHDEPTVRRLLAERDERIRVLTEALQRVKCEAVSLADAQVLALEALEARK